MQTIVNNLNQRTFVFETPSSKKGIHSPLRSIVCVYYCRNGNGYTNKKTCGLLILNKKWLKTNGLPADKIAIQVGGVNETYLFFNPPDNVPLFTARKSGTTNQIIFGCTHLTNKICDIFGLDTQKRHNFWLDYCGTYKCSQVYRLRNITPDDKLYL